MYKENPKTKGSGILCCIPQTGRCPVGCKGCFFQSGRGYLEPLDENLPNMPSYEQAEGFVVRVNDGNDSHNQMDYVIEATKIYKDKFYNTSCPDDLDDYDAPVVLTINPGRMTDKDFHRVRSRNLMAVRFRTNTWNLDLLEEVLEYYIQDGVTVLLTAMAYGNLEDIPEDYRDNYVERGRTLNTYWAIEYYAWQEILEDDLGVRHPLIRSCGYLEGWPGGTKCKDCGNCLRLYYNWKVAQ